MFCSPASQNDYLCFYLQLNTIHQNSLLLDLISAWISFQKTWTLRRPVDNWKKNLVVSPAFPWTSCFWRSHHPYSLHCVTWLYLRRIMKSTCNLSALSNQHHNVLATGNVGWEGAFRFIRLHPLMSHANTLYDPFLKKLNCILKVAPVFPHIVPVEKLWLGHNSYWCKQFRFFSEIYSWQ